jgi:hypothetical protein
MNLCRRMSRCASTNFPLRNGVGMSGSSRISSLVSEMDLGETACRRRSARTLPTRRPLPDDLPRKRLTPVMTRLIPSGSRTLTMYSNSLQRTNDADAREAGLGCLHRTSANRTRPATGMGTAVPTICRRNRVRGWINRQMHSNCGNACARTSAIDSSLLLRCDQNWKVAASSCVGPG